MEESLEVPMLCVIHCVQACNLAMPILKHEIPNLPAQDKYKPA